MSFLESLVGNAAITGEGIINSKIAQQNAIDQDNNRSANDLSNQKSLAQFNQELEIARTNTLKELAVKTGQSINEGADKAYRGRIAGIINSANGSSMSEEDARAIAENPAALKAYGVDARTRSQEYDDKIRAAESLGALPEAKELRGQQDVEYNRDRLASRDKKDDANTEIQNRRLDQQIKIQNAQLNDQIKHNRAMERSASETAKISPAAKAQIGMEESRLDAARQRLALAVTQSKAAATSMDTIAMQEAQTAIAEAQGGITAALESYNAVGRGHFGEQWISAKAAEPPAKQFPTPPQAALDLLAKNPDTRAQFEAKYGPAPKTDNAPAPAPAPKAKADDAAAPTSPSKPQPQTPMSALNKMQAKNLDALRTMAQQVAQAEVQLAAVAKSGDAKSTVSYAKNLQALREQMRASAAEHFGNGAQAAIAAASK